MSVCIDLPADLEASLRSQIANLDATAKEALLVELYRRGRITHHELASALDVHRFAIDELLGRYGVMEDLPSVSELRRQAAELELKLGR
jgi:hypothetical protein